MREEKGYRGDDEYEKERPFFFGVVVEPTQQDANPRTAHFQARASRSEKPEPIKPFGLLFFK